MANKIALICVLAALAVACSAQFYGGFGHGYGHGLYGHGFGHGGFYGHGHGHGYHGGHYAYPKYNYAYGVSDHHTGDNKQQSEYRDGGFTSAQFSQDIVHG